MAQKQIVTMLDDDSVFAAIRAGARGYLLKGADPTETLRAIRAVASGEAIFSPGIAERVMHYFAHPVVSPSQSVPLAQLSEREREVLHLLVQGITSNRELAERLVVSENTVKYHFRNILDKLHLQNRARVVAHAAKQGVFGAEDSTPPR